MAIDLLPLTRSRSTGRAPRSTITASATDWEDAESSARTLAETMNVLLIPGRRMNQPDWDKAVAGVRRIALQAADAAGKHDNRAFLVAGSALDAPAMSATPAMTRASMRRTGRRRDGALAPAATSPTTSPAPAPRRDTPPCPRRASRPRWRGGAVRACQALSASGLRIAPKAAATSAMPSSPITHVPRPIEMIASICSEMAPPIDRSFGCPTIAPR